MMRPMFSIGNYGITVALKSLSHANLLTAIVLCHVCKSRRHDNLLKSRSIYMLHYFIEICVIKIRAIKIVPFAARFGLVYQGLQIKSKKIY